LVFGNTDILPVVYTFYEWIVPDHLVNELEAKGYIVTWNRDADAWREGKLPNDPIPSDIVSVFEKIKCAFKKHVKYMRKQ
jgi:hypothetical protein